MRQNSRCAWSDARRILKKTTSGLAILCSGSVFHSENFNGKPLSFEDFLLKSVQIDFHLMQTIVHFHPMDAPLSNLLQQH